jgi:hypothetical protein
MRREIEQLLGAIARDESGGGLLSRETLRRASELRRAVGLWIEPTDRSDIIQHLSAQIEELKAMLHGGVR